MSAPFPARYPGACADCEGPISAGDLIYVAPELGGYAHDRCTDPLTAEHPVCQTCWLSHPEGACDR